MHPDELPATNAALNEQVKLLVKTEKRLYMAQRIIEKQLRRVELLNGFALESGRTSRHPDILAAANRMLLRVLRVDQVAAFLVGPDLRWSPAACSSASGFEAQGTTTPPPCALDGPLPDKPVIVRDARRDGLAGASALLVEAANLFDAPGIPEAPAIELVLPLRRRDHSLLGAVVLRTLDAVVSLHEELPSESDLPFLEVVCAHVETAVANVLLHEELSVLAAELEVKVEQRTHSLEIARRHAETANESLQQLFDHMRQAIIAFGPDGLITGRCSKEAARLFGTEELAGRPIDEVLFAGMAEYDGDRAVLTDFIEMAFGLSASEWSTVSPLLPRELVFHASTPRERVIVCEFRPIFSHGGLQRVMLLASDETEARRLSQAARTLARAHEREMALTSNLLAGGHLFVGFLRAAERRLERVGAGLGGTVQGLSSGALEALFQHAHTVKGEARLYQLTDLEKACARLEELLAGLRKGVLLGNAAFTSQTREEARNCLALAQQAIDDARARLIEASPIGSAVLDRIPVDQNDLDRLAQVSKRIIQQHPDAASLLEPVTARLTSRPFAELTTRLLDATPTWAGTLGKQAKLVVEGGRVLISPQLGAVLSGVLVHLVRNAVAHGVEPPDVRVAAGKPAWGTIMLAARTGSHGIELLIEDDGQGLNGDELRKRAALRGVTVEHGREFELVFVDGLSTHDNVLDLAGRGVGMGAVRAELEGVGYGIAVESVRGRYTRLILRPRAASSSSASP